MLESDQCVQRNNNGLGMVETLIMANKKHLTEIDEKIAKLSEDVRMSD